MRRARLPFDNGAAALCELLHQSDVGVQPAAGVTDHQIQPVILSLLNRLRHTMMTTRDSSADACAMEAQATTSTHFPSREHVAWDHVHASFI